MNAEAINVSSKQKEEPRSGLLEIMRNRRLPQDNRWSERFIRLSDFKRMIYWADQPDGGIGVSFVDPVEYCRLVHWTTDLNNAGFLSGQKYGDNKQEHILDKIFNGAKVTTISSESTSEIERELFTKSRRALQGYRWHWRSAYQCNGNRVDDVLIGWQGEQEPFSCYGVYRSDPFDSDKEPNSGMIPNDFSNIAFNYVFLHSIVSDNLLFQKIAGCKFFTDGQVVDTRFGYYSPAYALALLQSLQKRDLVNVAMRSFSNFVHYHPIDPITTLCDRIARQTFQGVVCGREVKNARDMRHNYSMIDRFIEAEDDERDYRKSQYELDDYNTDDYVDDPDPYYQEMEYLNTH